MNWQQTYTRVRVFYVGWMTATSMYTKTHASEEGHLEGRKQGMDGRMDECIDEHADSSMQPKKK